MELKSSQNSWLMIIAKKIGYNRSKRFWIVLLLSAFILYTFLIFLFGGYMHKNGVLSIYSGTIKPLMTELKLVVKGKQIRRIPKVFARMLFAKPKHITIDIKHIDFQKLAYQREIALANGTFLGSSDDFVPAKIRYKDKTVKVKMRLKGHLPDHWSDDAKWSFRFNVKGDNRLFGMDEFSIHHPRTRGYLNEWYYNQMLKYNGLISRYYDFIDVTINGKHLGIYAIDEHFDKRLIENNQLREGPIICFNDNLYWLNYMRDRNAMIDYQETYWLELTTYQGKRC